MADCLVAGFSSVVSLTSHLTPLGPPPLRAVIGSQRSQLLGKNPDAAKDGRQEEKAATEDEMAGWHH